MARTSISVEINQKSINDYLERYRRLLEMANMTQKLNETKKTISGKIINSGKSVLLDNQFNGAMSWKISDKFLSNLKDGDLVNVVFTENKISTIIKTQETQKKSVDKQEITNLIPENGFYVTKEQKRILDVAAKAFEDKNNPHKGFVVSLRGDAGTGKTSIAQHFAFENKLPILVIDCSTISDNGDWFLIPGFKNQETVFDKTQFTEFLLTGNCVILLDEVNRMPPYISNALLPILDHRRFTSLRGVDIQVNNKVAFFMTSNHGYSYTGTNPIDQALKRRIVGTIKVGNLPPDVETELLMKRMGLDYESARIIVKVFVSLRDSQLKEFPVNIATGTSLNVAWWVNYGLSIAEAFTVAIMNDAPEDSHKIILDALRVNGQF